MDPISALDHLEQANRDDYLDTVTLLQEEIDRLEAELRVWTEASVDPTQSPAELTVDPEANRRIDELTALLDERDETINLLWEHLSTVEATQAARSAEWEELHRWVEELEQRLENADLLDHKPSTNGQIAETFHDQLEAQRQTWERERQQLEAELARVRHRLETERGSAGNQQAAELEQENHRLRDECRQLSRFEAESDGLKERVTQLQTELETTREQLRALTNDLQNERLRHENELAELRSGQAIQRFSAADLTPSERVRALREHLLEVHAREEEERKERQLSTRIARLLGRTGSR